MAFVTHLLRERFGLTQARALQLMYVTHLRGGAPIVELPHGEARELARRARDLARGAAYPFALRLVRTASADDSSPPQP